MAQKLVEAELTTRTARRRLPSGLHWRRIDPDVHLGYRRGKRPGGRWLVRWRLKDGRYQQEVIGTADDVLGADGVHAYSFDQASTRARALIQGRRSGKSLSIKQVIDEYVADREKVELGKKHDARSRLTRHVLSDEVSNKNLHSIVASDLKSWSDRLPPDLAPSTIRRLVNDFKAALNRAVNLHEEELPPTLQRTIRNGLRLNFPTTSNPRKAQVLSDPKMREVIQAAEQVDKADGWDGDLLRLVLVLAATGARFSQVLRLTIGDLEGSRLHVPTSRKGRPLKQRQRVAVRLGPDVAKALRAIAIGRHDDEPLLERWRWKQLGPAKWIKDRRGPWQFASELTRPWEAIRRGAGLSDDVVPYALRHSSIVRYIRAGLPLRYIASLHDTSTAMIERHYSAFIVDALDDIAERALTQFVQTRPGAVPPAATASGKGSQAQASSSRTNRRPAA
jgi:integrase